MLFNKKIQIGDLVYLKNVDHTDYSWHIEFPKTRFIGIVKDIQSGYSMAGMVWVDILHPRTPAMDNYIGNEISWTYELHSCKKVNLNKLTKEEYKGVMIGLL